MRTKKIPVMIKFRNKDGGITQFKAQKIVEVKQKPKFVTIRTKVAGKPTEIKRISLQKPKQTDIGRTDNFKVPCSVRTCCYNASNKLCFCDMHFCEMLAKEEQQTALALLKKIKGLYKHGYFNFLFVNWLEAEIKKLDKAEQSSANVSCGKQDKK